MKLFLLHSQKRASPATATKTLTQDVANQDSGCTPLAGLLKGAVLSQPLSFEVACTALQLALWTQSLHTSVHPPLTLN